MQEVKIAELKARLSHYLRLAQDGEEVLVKDRERPVARLVAYDASTRRLHTVAPRMARKEAEKILAKLPRPRLSWEVVEDTLRWMREDRADHWLGDMGLSDKDKNERVRGRLGNRAAAPRRGQPGRRLG